jgi:hypothetical protein
MQSLQRGFCLVVHKPSVSGRASRQAEPRPGMGWMIKRHWRISGGELVRAFNRVIEVVEQEILSRAAQHPLKRGFLTRIAIQKPVVAGRLLAEASHTLRTSPRKNVCPLRHG